MKRFIRQMFSASDAASWGRLSSAVTLLAVVGWVTYLVVTNHVLPDLAGSAVLVGTPYGISKAGETVQKLKNGSNGSNEDGARDPKLP